MLNSTAKFFVIGLLGGVAAAQTAATPGTPVKTTIAPGTPVKTTAAKTQTPAKATVAIKTVAKPVVKPAAAPAKKVAPPVKTAEKAKPSPVKEATTKDKEKTVAMNAHHRDPFVNPMQLQEDKLKNTAACTTGARCLMIDQVVLKGVIKTTQGMIAMVENSARKQYNLREKDPVYNGFV